MKTMVSVLLGLGLLSAGSATAALININYTMLGSSYSGAAVVGSAGDTWNSVALPYTSGSPLDQTASSLLDSDGTATGVSLRTYATGSFSGSGNASGTMNANGFGSTGYTELMNSYAFIASGGSGALTFSGLSANSAYDLYIYSEGDVGATGRRFSATVGGTTLTTAAADPNVSSFVSGQNYLLFHATSDASGTLEIALASVTDEININGLQLVAVPEPGSLALLGLGVAALGLRRRVRKA